MKCDLTWEFMLIYEILILLIRWILSKVEKESFISYNNNFKSLNVCASKNDFCLIVLNFMLKTDLPNAKKISCLISSFKEILRRTKREFILVLLSLGDAKNCKGKKKQVS